MILKEYPNLQAILSGTIAGGFRDWPTVRPELIKLVAKVEKLNVLLIGEVKLVEDITKLETQVDKLRKALEDERERCAKVADDASTLEGGVYGGPLACEYGCSEVIAAAIRKGVMP